MTELIVNLIQLITAGICTFWSLWRTIRLQKREWIMLTLFYATFFLGSLYWQLYLLFYGGSPKYPYISGMCWHASWLFLLLLLIWLGRDQKKKYLSRLSWIGPVFAGIMCVIFMQWGRYADNVITGLLMALIIMRAITGLYCLRKDSAGKEKQSDMYVITLVYCAVEYTMWIISCFPIGWGDTMANPYYWFNLVLPASFLFFMPALGKAVDR